jgi:hypothetical protein
MRIPFPASSEEIKEWRTREAAAGRPAEFSDCCRVYALAASSSAFSLAMTWKASAT